MDTITVLYDIENSSIRVLEYALAKARELSDGPVQVFSDWTLCGRQKKWQAFFHSHAVDFMQIGRTCDGKNALDKALFETALTVQEQGRRFFIVVTSDTDFEKLARELHRRPDAYVMGVGCNKNNAKRSKIYDRFYTYSPAVEAASYIQMPAAPVMSPARTAAMLLQAFGEFGQSPAGAKKRAPAPDPQTAAALLRLFDQIAGGDTWVALSTIGMMLKKQECAIQFPPGHPTKLKNIMALYRDYFEMNQEETIAYVRRKCGPAAVAAPPAPAPCIPASIPPAASVRPPQPPAAPARDKAAAPEYRVKWEMALLMLNEGISVHSIHAVTDFSVAEIENLRNLLQKLKK